MGFSLRLTALNKYCSLGPPTYSQGSVYSGKKKKERQALDKMEHGIMCVLYVCVFFCVHGSRLLFV